MSQIPFDPSKFGPDATKGSGNSGAPEGAGKRWLPIGARSAERQAGAEQFGPQALAQFTTGRNMESQESGWNTPFLNKFMSDWQQSLRDPNQNTNNWFREKRDGIALWDDEEYGIKFGDVFSGGQKVENLYDTYGKDFADNVMRPFVLSANEQRNNYSVDKRRSEISDEVATTRRAGDNQKKFDEAVVAEKSGWDEFIADAATIVTGVAGGAVTGLTFGGLPGAVLGGVLGGVGAWSNQDEIQDMYARGEVRAEMAEEQFGRGAGVTERLSSWGGIAAQQFNPLGNLLKGAADQQFGEIGDDKSEFYAVDPVTGERVRSKLWDAANLATVFVGGAGQMGSSVGRLAFQGQMTALIGGGAGGLITTGGHSFDDRMAEFDNIFLDEEGNADWFSGAMGIGQVGIDVVQLGFARGLMSAAGQMGGGAKNAALAKLEGSAKGQSLLKESAERFSAGGYRFTRDPKTGEILSARGDWAAWLAPSEFVQYGSTRVAALIARSRSGSSAALSADDLYRAAASMSSNARVVSSALINGFGESVEEGVQALMEPLSHNHRPELRDVGSAMLAGFAMGAGMTAGSRIGVQRAEAREVTDMLRMELGMGYTRDELEAMSPEERAGIRQSGSLKQLMAPVEETLAREQLHTRLASDALADRQMVAASAFAEAEKKSANPATDRARVASQAPPETPDHVVLMSINDLTLAAEARLDAAEKLIEQLSNEVDSADLLQLVESEVGVLFSNFQEIKAVRDRYYDPAASPAQRAQLLESLNRRLQLDWDAWTADSTGVEEARARAAGSVIGRFPTDNQLSNVVMLPQAMDELSTPREDEPQRGTGDGGVLVSLGNAQGFGLDFDGDKLMQLTRLMLTKPQYTEMRIGGTMKAAGGSVNISVTAAEEEIITLLHQALQNPSGQSGRLADQLIKSMRTWLTDRYGREIDGGQYIKEFLDDVRAGNVKAKATFFNNLLQHREVQLQELARSKGLNPWLDINSYLRRELWRFQRDSAREESGGAEFKLTPGRFAPVTATSVVGRAREAMAATFSQRAVLAFVGDNLFRSLQKLNYAKTKSPIYDLTPDDLTAISQMQQAYAAASSGMVDSKLETLLSKDEVTRNVVRKLDAFLIQMRASNPNMAGLNAMLLAQLAVPKMVRGKDNQFGVHGTQTVLQWFLEEETRAMEARYGGSITDEVATKMAALRSLDANRAFVEVYGPYQMQSLLGLDADVFGGHLTVEQVFAMLVNQDTYHRSMTTKLLHSHASYLVKSEKEGRKNSPIFIPQNDDLPPLTAYQIMVDTLVSAANNEISYDASAAPGKRLGGELARRSAKKTEQLHQSLSTLWEGLAKAGINRKSRDDVLTLFKNEPGLARKFLGMYSNKAVMWALTADGTASPWVVDAFMARTPAEAHMIMFRGQLLAEWNAFQMEFEDPTKVKRSFYDMSNRFHVLMYQLNQSPNKAGLASFLNKLSTSTSVDEFVDWVNHPKNLMRANTAPYTVWFTDVSDIDPSVSKGSLSRISEGAEAREAVSDFHAYVKKFIPLLQERKAEQEATNKLLSEIRKERALPPERRVYTASLQQKLDFILNYNVSLGPAAVYDFLAGMLEVPTNATDKGKSIGYSQNVGAFDMLRTMRQFGTGEAAVLRSLTAESWEALLSNPTKLREPMRVMDSQGNLHQWPGLTVDMIVDNYSDAHAAELISRIMVPSAMEMNGAGVLEQQFFTDTSLVSLATKNEMTDAVWSQDPVARGKFVSLVDGASENHALVAYLATLTSAMTSAATVSVVGREGVGQSGAYASEAMTTVATVLQKVAPLIGIPNTGPTAETVTTYDIFGDPVEVTPPTKLGVVKARARAALIERNKLGQLSKEESQQLDQILVSLNLLSSQFGTPQLNKAMNSLADLKKVSVLPQLLSAYGYRASAKRPWAETVELRQRILNYVHTNSGLMVGAAPWAASVRDALSGQTPLDMDGLPKLGHDGWDELSRVVIAHKLADEVALAIPGQPNMRIDDLDDLKYRDPTYGFLVDDLLDDDSPVIKALSKVWSTFNMQSGATSVAEVMQTLDKTLLRPGLLGAYSEPVVQQVMEGRTRLLSAPAEEGIKGSGIIPKTYVGDVFGHRYTYDQTNLDSYVSTVQYTVSDVPKAVLPVTTPAGAQEQMLRLEVDGSFTRVGAYTVTVNGQTYDPDGLGQLIPMQSLKRVLLGQVALPYDTGEPGWDEWGVVTTQRLDDAVRQLAKTLKVNVSDITVNLPVLRMQDADPAIHGANNLYFMGVVPNSTRSESLVASALTGTGGWLQANNTRTLQASKKGTPAMTSPKIPSLSEVKLLETDWQTNLLDVLRSKALMMLEPGRVGKGVTLEPTTYKALLKLQMNRHVVRWPNPAHDPADPATGPAMTVLPAEEVIRQQTLGTPLDANAELIELTDEAVARLFGDPEAWASSEVARRDMTVDMFDIIPWEGSFTTEHEMRLPGLFNPRPAGSLLTTPLAGSRSFRKIRGFDFTAPSRLHRLQQGLELESNVAMDVLQERAVTLRQKDIEAAATLAGQALTVDLQQQKAVDALVGSSAIPSSLRNSPIDQAVVTNLVGEVQSFVDTAAHRGVHVYKHTFDLKVDTTTRFGQLFGLKALARGGPKASWVVLGDTVVVDVDSFDPTDLKSLARVLDLLAGYGANIVFAGSMNTELKADGIEYIANSQMFSRVAGANTVWKRTDAEGMPVTLEAMYSKLGARGAVDARRLSTVFQANWWGEENWGAALDERHDRNRILASVVLPISKFGSFNLASDDTTRQEVIDRMLAGKAEILEKTLRYDSRYQELKKIKSKRRGQPRADERAQEIEEDLNRAIDKAANLLGPGGFYPPGTKLQLGDIIPLVDTHGRVVMMRYGYQLPRSEDYDKMMQEDGFVVYQATLDPNWSASDGELTEALPLSGQGLELRLLVPRGSLLAKMVADPTGAKFLNAPIPKSYDFSMAHVLPGVPMDEILNRVDIEKKNNYEGTINGFQTAFTYLGVDFRADLARALFGDDSPASVAQVPATLKEMQRHFNKFPITRVHEDMKSMAVSAELLRVAEELPILASRSDALLAAMLDDQQDPDTKILIAALTYLTWEHAEVDDILFSTGMGATGIRTAGNSLRMMPSLFTQVFDRLPTTDPLHQRMIERLNDRIPNTEQAPWTNPKTGKQELRRIGYRLNPDFTVTHVNKNPEFDRTGWLQFAEFTAAPTTPEADAASANRTARQGSGEQLQQVFGGLTGIRPGQERNLPKLRSLMSEMRPDTTQELLQTYRTIPSEPTVRAPRMLTAAENEYMLHARQLVIDYAQPLDFSDWDSTRDLSQEAEYVAARNAVAAKLGLSETEAVVLDGWVRQHQGKPTLTKQQIRNSSPSELEELLRTARPRFDQAMRALEMIDKNVEEGNLPVAHAAVSRMSMADLTLLHRASQRSGASFKLRRDPDDPQSATDAWSDWYHINMSVGALANEFYDPMFLAANDGMLHTFFGSGAMFGAVPVSSDPGMAALLLSDLTDVPISIDPNRRLTLSAEGKPTLTFSMNPTADAVNQRVRASAYKWRMSTEQKAKPVGGTTRDLAAHGMRLATDHSRTATALQLAVSMRAFMALADPRLILGAPMEAALQSLTEGAANLLTGKGRRGLLKASEERAAFDQLNQTNGRNPYFLNMLYNEFKANAQLETGSRIVTKVGKAAEFVGRLQDPSYGMSRAGMSKRYMLTVLRGLDDLGSLSPYTAQEVIAGMAQDAHWVQVHTPALHQMALANIANIRCVKTTTMSRWWRNTLEPLTAGNRLGTNVAGTLMLQIPFLFANYGFNTAVRMLGLQGFDAWWAAWLSGRPRGKINKMARGITNAAGGTRDDFVDGENVYDYTEVLESVDLAHAFVKGGLSWTGLFAFALLAGGLGGEDEEDKRLRRIASMKGVPHVYDPRDIANDFRNADVIYFNGVPFLNEFFRVTTGDEDGEEQVSMARMNFLAKQVLSPVIGIERFMATGNPWEILWGFEEAVTSLPLINTMAWESASSAYVELMAMAEDKTKTGNMEDIPEAYRFALSAVFTLERMLLENSFANQVYRGLDPYDRDPWKIPDKTGTGETMTDRLGNPLPTGALREFVDEETGEIRSGYRNRSAQEAYWYSMTENRLSLALLHEAVTLGQADALRRNQVVKLHTVKGTEITADEAYASIEIGEDGAGVVYALWKGAANPKEVIPPGYYMTKETRLALKDRLQGEIIQEGLNQGMSQYEAERWMWSIWNGPKFNSQVPGLNDLLFKEEYIPYSGTVKYRQLNTDYIKGPDGNMWAVGNSRRLMDTGLGMLPFTRFIGSDMTGLGEDSRLNSTDPGRNLNTGRRGLERVDESEKAVDPVAEALEKLAQNGSFSNNGSNSGNGWVDYPKRSGWRNFGRRSGWRNFGRRRGGGGGGGGGGSFTRLNAPQDNQTPYGNTMQNVNANNPIIRRSTIRRERSDSQRGRLKPWQ